MPEITLSYILTTRNKLPYLREVLPDLIAAKKPGDEILIADGASTDGTKEYLQNLFDQKKIDYFISEPDKGEAHGFNKLIATARGTVIKLITDDDAFYYPGIEMCKKFMLEHPEIDFLSTEGIKRRKNPTSPFAPMFSRPTFEQWQQTHIPFAFCGLGIMIRRSSLPLLGYLHTGVARVDAEYAFRVTASKAKIAWYTGEVFAHLLNENSNSITQVRRMTDEMERLEAFYLAKPLQTALEKKLRDIARPIKQWLKNKAQPSNTAKPEPHIILAEWREMYRSSVDKLKEDAQGNMGEFLY